MPSDINRHILTGLGVYYYIVFLIYLRLCLEGNRRKFNFIWAYGFLPHIERKDIGKENGNANGTPYSNGLKRE
jgi:dihydroceramidase